MIAVKHTEMLEVGNVKAQNSGGPHGLPENEENVLRDSSKSSISEVSKVAGVGERTVKRAKQALQIAPEKADAMISGETTT